eukprot:TRINITY_DN2291_c0_g2_i1.p1 TRINITY_DN2291_c0_g2~~TRINITY_DN2291_c0_g2_i1.p1  ORF type:complete len:468 (+),score=85.22 TRINITY_DN2291_c0_g2_i1:50-1453(+)
MSKLNNREYILENVDQSRAELYLSERKLDLLKGDVKVLREEKQVYSKFLLFLEDVSKVVLTNRDSVVWPTAMKLDRHLSRIKNSIDNDIKEYDLLRKEAKTQFSSYKMVCVDVMMKKKQLKTIFEMVPVTYRYQVEEEYNQVEIRETTSNAANHVSNLKTRLSSIESEFRNTEKRFKQVDAQVSDLQKKVKPVARSLLHKSKAKLFGTHFDTFKEMMLEMPSLIRQMSAVMRLKESLLHYKEYFRLMQTLKDKEDKKLTWLLNKSWYVIKMDRKINVDEIVELCDAVILEFEKFRDPKIVEAELQDIEAKLVGDDYEKFIAPADRIQTSSLPSLELTMEEESMQSEPLLENDNLGKTQLSLQIINLQRQLDAAQDMVEKARKREEDLKIEIEKQVQSKLNSVYRQMEQQFQEEFIDKQKEYEQELLDRRKELELELEKAKDRQMKDLEREMMYGQENLQQKKRDAGG